MAYQQQQNRSEEKPKPKIDEGEMKAIVAMADALPSIAITEAGITFATLRDVYILSRIFIASGWVPKGIDTAEKVMTCLLQARALGIDPYVALWNTAPIGNRPTIYGDLVPGLCMARKGVRFEEWWELDDERVERRPSYSRKEDFPDSLTACCRVLAKDGTLLAFGQFSVADAKLFKVEEWRGEYGTRDRQKVSYSLWDKEGPWQNAPWRQLRFRAMTFAARDACPDVLKGVGIFEELQDIGDARQVDHTVRDTKIGEMPPTSPTLKAEDVNPSDELAAMVATLRRSTGAEDKARVLAILDEHGIRLKKRTLRDALDAILESRNLELARKITWELNGPGEGSSGLATAASSSATQESAQENQKEENAPAGGNPSKGPSGPPAASASGTSPANEEPGAGPSSDAPGSARRVLEAKIRDKKVTDIDLNAAAGSLFGIPEWRSLNDAALDRIRRELAEGTLWEKVDRL